MVTRQHLTPTRIVNKNGVATTVYRKRPDAAIASQSIPVLSASRTPSRAKTISELSKTFCSEGSLTSIHPHTRGAVMDSLHEYSDAMLERISHILQNDPARNHSSVFERIRVRIIEGHSEGRINETICFSHVLKGEGSHIVQLMLDSLHTYDQLPQTDDLSLESQRTIDQCVGLLHVIRPLSNMVGVLDNNWKIENDELVEVVLNQPEQAERIADFIEDRQVIEVDLIKEMLANESPALSDGAL